MQGEIIDRQKNLFVGLFLHLPGVPDATRGWYKNQPGTEPSKWYYTCVDDSLWVAITNQSPKEIGQNGQVQVLPPPPLVSLRGFQ